MGTELPAELVGTAIAKPGDTDAHIAAYELAMKRLHDAAIRRGVFIGEPTLHTEPAPTSVGNYQILVLAAPVLDTGTDEKLDAISRETIDEPWPDQTS